MLELKTQIEGKTMIISIFGEIDHHTARDIRAKVDALIMSARPKEIALDLSCISFMDSSGLGLIMGRYALAREIDAEICVLRPTDAVARIILMAGLDKIVPIKRSLDEKTTVK